MGTIQIDGSTPKLTIGNATAEDALIVFDGNAQDFYIGLDDSADDLVIGLGSAAGTTPAISINEDRDVTISDGAIDFDVASHDTSNGLKLGGTLVTATAAELNIMDGVTATAAEINLIDGGTSRGTTAIADGDGVLINDAGTMRMTTVQTLATYIGGSDPSSADGDSLGTASLEWSDLYLADSSVIYFGNDQEIKLTHVADTGLALKHTATADDKPIVLTLQTGETDMAADDVIGKIAFQAPDEGTGTDAILVSAAIQAVAEGDHSSSSNATRLEFHTGASELATAKMNISSAGDVGIGGTPVADRKLKIFGTASNRALVVANSGDQYAYATFVGNNTTDDGQVRFGACDDAAIIMAGNAVALRITDAQKVGIGESSPLGQLHVKSADSGAAAHANADELVIEGSGASGMTIASGASSNGCIFFSDSGDNNIGYIEYKHGTDNMTIGVNAANAINIDDSQVAAGDFNDTSDVGLKENIQTISTAIDMVKQLRPVTFDWKKENKGSASGFIAQEVELLLPNDVKGDAYNELDPDKNIGKALNATGVLAHVTKALQEAITKIETLEAKVTVLEG